MSGNIEVETEKSMRNELYLKISVCILFVLSFSSFASAGTWKTIDFPNMYPGMPDRFQDGAVGISSNFAVTTCVANYTDHACLYNGSTFTLLDAPGASYTRGYGIDGSNLVGTYIGASGSRGFIYNISSQAWTTVGNMPGYGGTEVYGIDGSKVIGMTINLDGTYAKPFIFDGSTWQLLDMPNSNYLQLYGISGNKAVGTYSDLHTAHGCLYDNGQWKTIDVPGAYDTYALGIEGNKIVGTCSLSQKQLSFLYDGSSYITFSKPGAYFTKATSIDGDNIAGLYMDNAGIHGFIYTIPEPATFFVLAAGVMTLRNRKYKS